MKEYSMDDNPYLKDLFSRLAQAAGQPAPGLPWADDPVTVQHPAPPPGPSPTPSPSCRTLAAPPGWIPDNQAAWPEGTS